MITNRKTEDNKMLINKQLNKKEIINEIEKLTENDFYNKYWLDKITFVSHIKISNELKTLLNYYIENDEVILVGEYWADDNSFRYILEFEDDRIAIEEII
jgi:hypothetical protein